MAGDVGRAVTHDSEEVESLDAVLRGDGVKPLRREQRREHVAHVGIVLDDQHAHSTTSPSNSPGGWHTNEAGLLMFQKFKVISTA